MCKTGTVRTVADGCIFPGRRGKAAGSPAVSGGIYMPATAFPAGSVQVRAADCEKYFLTFISGTWSVFEKSFPASALPTLYPEGHDTDYFTQIQEV